MMQTDIALKELAHREDDLYLKIFNLYHQPQSKDTSKQLSEIFIEYKKVHKAYAELSSHDIEALKRGLEQ